MKFVAVVSTCLVVLAVGMVASALLTFTLDHLLLDLVRATGPAVLTCALLASVLGLGLYRRSTQRPQADTAPATAAPRANDRG